MQKKLLIINYFKCNSDILFVGEFLQVDTYNTCTTRQEAYLSTGFIPESASIRCISFYYRFKGDVGGELHLRMEDMGEAPVLLWIKVGKGEDEWHRGAGVIPSKTGKFKVSLKMYFKSGEIS